MEENNNREEDQSEVLIDFEGKKREGVNKYDRVVVKDDVYTAKIISLELQDTPKYEASGTEKTIIAKVEPVEGKGTIPFFISPKVTKAYNEKVSNSKLYDLFEKAGLLEEAKNMKDELTTLTGLCMFVEKKFKGREIKFLTKTRKAGTDKAYSSVDRVLEFLPSGDAPVSKEVKPVEAEPNA